MTEKVKGWYVCGAESSWWAGPEGSSQGLTASDRPGSGVPGVDSAGPGALTQCIQSLPAGPTAGYAIAQPTLYVMYGCS